MDDEEGFAEWFREHHPRLVSSMAVATGDFDLGREVASEACARALERWGRVGSMASPEAWTYRVALNIVRRHYRRAALERRIRQRAGAPRSVAFPDTSFDTWEAVFRLPPRTRTAIALRYFSDLTEPEIAHIMGVAPGTVSASLHAGRQQLSRTLAEHEEVTRG